MRRLLVACVMALVAGAVVSLALGASGAAPAGRWVIRDLRAVGVSGGEAVAINDRGRIVGTAYRAGRRRPELWRNGRLSFLPTRPGMPNGSAHEINASGQIIGSIWGPSGGREVIWTPLGSA